MKLPAIVSAILALVAIVLLFFIDFSDPRKRETFDMAELTQSTGEAQADQLESILTKSSLPKGHEIELLKWIFTQNNESAIQLIRDHAKSIELLPSFLGQAAIQLIQENDSESTIRLLNLARQYFPNDPDILTASGMVTYLAGEKENARRLLEQAKTWRQENPIADFYLGLILIQSDSVSDKARGKHFLKEVALLKTHRFSEESALMLLTLEGIPMVEEETETLLELLVEMDSFRLDNKLLNPVLVRRLGNAAARVDQALALELAGLLMEFPEVTVRDRIVYIHLLNNSRQYSQAAELLNDVLEDPNLDVPDTERAELARLQAFGNLAAGNYPEAIEAYTSLSGSQGDEPQLHDLFRQALNLDLPIDTQRKLFPLYLDLPILSTKLSLMVLERLMEVAPLDEDLWTEHAASKLLAKNPLLVAPWLTAHGKEAAIVGALSRVEEPLSQQQGLVLVEAYLSLENPEAAQQALKTARPLLNPAHAEFLQARIYLQEGNLPLAQEQWTAAHNAAMGSNEYEMMKNLGFLALKLDQPVNALQSLYAAFTAGIQFSPSQANQLIALTLKYGNLNQSTKVAEYLYNSFPDEPVFINNLAYFKFLAGVELDDYVAKMRPLTEEYPDILNYRMTLGLGLLKSGRKNEAMRLMESPPIDFNKTSTQGQVIYAAILIANNQQFVAEGLIQSIDKDELIPEERALIESR